MDISDISKVATRKRMSDDVEKLREKVSRETAKIIKLKVAQDTAYWDLKEKLQAVEANHERLQANMVDVQMQHEAISSAYHRELRLRPETLNKLASTRDICDALEEYTARVRGSLRRAAADTDRLRAAYGEAGARAARATVAAAAAARAHRAALGDHAARLHAGAEREAARRGDLLAAAAAEAQRLRDTIQVRERELEKAGARVAALHRDLDDLRNREVEERKARREAETEVERLTAELEASRAHLERSATEVREAQNAAATLREELGARTQGAAADLAAERERGRVALGAARAEAAEFRGALDRTEAALREETAARIAAEAALREESAARERVQAALDEERAARARAAAARDEESAARAGLEGALERERAAAAERAARADAELAARGEAVAGLMRDVTAEAEARARAEAALRARDQALRDKDDELARQMAIILEVRAEKERLQEKIGGMQATIDNIQKELTGGGPRAARAEPPVRDRDEEPGLRPHPDQLDGDAMLYSFLSDSSMDADPDGGLGEREVQRRFEALSRDAARAAHRLRPPGGAARGAAGRGAGAAGRGAGAAGRGAGAAGRGAELRGAAAPPERTFFKNKRLDSKHK